MWIKINLGSVLQHTLQITTTVRKFRKSVRQAACFAVQTNIDFTFFGRDFPAVTNPFLVSFAHLYPVPESSSCAPRLVTQRRYNPERETTHWVAQLGCCCSPKGCVWFWQICASRVSLFFFFVDSWWALSNFLCVSYAFFCWVRKRFLALNGPCKTWCIFGWLKLWPWPRRKLESVERGFRCRSCTNFKVCWLVGLWNQSLNGFSNILNVIQ